MMKTDCSNFDSKMGFFVEMIFASNYLGNPLRIDPDAKFDGFWMDFGQEKMDLSIPF